MRVTNSMQTIRSALARNSALLLLLGLCFNPVTAQETVCASVKMEIKQELTLERQAFDAEMKINNTTDVGAIDNVLVEVKVTDENGVPVAITSDPNDLSARFFIRISNRENIASVDGNGVVNPKTTAIINWLLIPAPGAAGDSPLGKKYLVGATLKYRFGGEETTLDVSPDVITVKPLPRLTLDYFLPRDVWADDPLTAEVEEVEPFTLGVRVKNNGNAVARNLKIDSAQPKIIENNQGLLINFVLTGSYVDDAPAQNTLLIDFGDIAPERSKMGRWNMETTLAGRFTEFTARFTHADELGGMLTSILEATDAHVLIHDVRVDLPGRDHVRDFLAQDGDFIRIYESDGPDTEVTDRSSVATLTSNGAGNYNLTFPPTAGFIYVRLPDPFRGAMDMGRIVRSDAKELAPENVWFSRARDPQTKQWSYWVNFFDVNSTGVYTSEFRSPQPVARAPVIQFIPDRTALETKPMTFLVEASSPDGRNVTLSAASLPSGAKLTLDTSSPVVAGTRMVFDWTPPKGSAGTYLITYTAQDGHLSASRSASIKVEAEGNASQPGPGTPTVVTPGSGTQVHSLTPTLSARTSNHEHDTSTQVQFELYTDEAMTQQVASSTVPKAAAGPGNGGGDVVSPTDWKVPLTLDDNTHYWWRVRSFDGELYSPWVNARFFANTYNDPPDTFNLTYPAAGADVSSFMPQLAWTNSFDKDGDIITYSVMVYKDSALSEVVAETRGLAEDPSGSTHWTLEVPLSDHTRYYWRVIAEDVLGAQTLTPARFFNVNVSTNSAPGVPTPLYPPMGGQSANIQATLTVQNSVDVDGDLITYIFEIDTTNTFDSADKRSSGPVLEGNGNTSWTTPPLVENTRYWWRVKAQDGQADSAWVVSDFLMNAFNEAPPAPTIRNPGDHAWAATRFPVLEANPVEDPEGEAVRYQFEVFTDAGLTQKVAEGGADNTALVLPSQLEDRTTHWWHVRALDEHNAASAWSAPAVLYISTGVYQEPSIMLTSPVTPIIPDAVDTLAGKRWQVSLNWESADANIEPTVALYWDTRDNGFAGNLIVDGLRQKAGLQSGSYLWDVTDLVTTSPGTAFYVYAIIYDPKGVGKAYAPGAIIAPATNPSGKLVITKGDGSLRTSEAGQTATFSARLNKAPKFPVIVPVASGNTREGAVSPTSLTFTSGNWSVDQSVTVTGQDDCVADGEQVYEILLGKAQSLDPNFAGIEGKPITTKNRDDKDDFSSNTNQPNLYICSFKVLSETKPASRVWEYKVSAELNNIGEAIGGATAKLQPITQQPIEIQLVSNELKFGAVGKGETAKTADTVILRANGKITEDQFNKAIGSLQWKVEIRP